MPVIALLITLLGTAPFAVTSPIAAGTITGCVTDTNGNLLPGVTVTVTVAGATRRSVSDARGCFVVSNIPPGNAVIEATLAGFRTERRDVVSVTGGGEIRVDLSMCVSGLAEIDWVFPSAYAQFLNSADAVLHVRINRTVPLHADCGQSGWVHSATVLHSVKGGPGLDPQSTVTFFQEHWAQEQHPYPVNTELVLALTASSGRYVRTAGPHAVFVVTGERVRGTLPGLLNARYDGMELDAYLSELERLVK